MSSIAGIYGKLPHNVKIADLVHDISGKMIRGGVVSVYSSEHLYLEVNSLMISKVNNIQYFEDDKYVIAIDGELTNRGELIKLIKDNRECSGALNDISIIALLINCLGFKFVNQIDGQYCILVFEKANDTLHLIRDRWAQKPIYYINFSEYVVFSSEIKGFTALPNWKAKLNLVTARDYLLWSGMRDISNQTLFDGVFQIEAGYHFSIDSKMNQKYKRYYDISKVNRIKNIKSTEAIVTFADLLKESINFCVFTSDDIRKVGTCLSGGIDSTTIASYIVDCYDKNNINHSLDAFTAYFSAPEADEREYIDEAVEKLKLNSKKISPQFSDFTSELDKLIWIQDEPFSSSAIYAQYKVYECAAENGILFLCDGQAADEYLCGYRSHQIAYLCDLIRGFHILQLKAAIKTIKSKYHDKVHFLELIKQLVCRPLPKSMVYNQAKRRNAEYGFKYLPPQDKLLYENERNVKTTLRDFSIMQIKVGWQKLYHHIDRNAMSNLVVNRAPYSPTKMIEYVLSLPEQILMSEGITKHLLRNVARGYTPDKILDRYSKLGFKTPEADWFETNQEWFRNEYKKALDKMDKIIDGNKVKDIKDRDFIFRIICFSHWMDIFHVEI